ncbi:ABC transporter substrate-binding protein [Allostreptomyces psammosilenae]|uniref:Raffinose/stachyose/melibiose transport system substrate-binding protein n=1 Tax=Allostreptomyces psammosilenae TaxID=1892865 RepID=A0A852ZM86_9ACTN|nr:ABC transporter substrate-binding protein [Allostreptomyces psammosilenae]NYI03513.1 raffinose/stachyose/melibiose transport system substrate-binding protein [Allostreptomyces psammosilenae]
MRQRRITAAALATGVLLLAGCSDPGAGTNTDAGPVSWPEPTAALDGTTLTIWAAQNSNMIPESVAAAFEEATGAEIEVVTIPDPYEQGVQTKVASGDKPDLAFWQPTASMLTAINAPTNLQPLDGAPWLEAMDPALRDITGLADGTRYAALISSPAVQGVYYNKEVFAEHGVTAPPTDWDGFVELARSLKEQGVTPFHEMGGDRWATQWWVQVQLADVADQLWERVNSGEEEFTDPTILDAITEYQALIEEGLFNEDIRTATFEDQADALLAGDAAMAMQVNSFFGQLQAKADTAELDERIGFFPISTGGNVGTFIPDQSNALVAFRTGDAEREAAARQFLSYWLGEGYQGFVEDRKTVSIMSDVPSPDGIPQALLDVHAAVATSAGSMQALAIANPDLYLNLADMIQGALTPEEVAQRTQEQFAQLARAQGAPGF